jgi:centrosomal protein CEP41
MLIARDRFPQQMHLLVRSADQKNKPNKLIIIYHEDDKSGIQVASVLFEKGFDNIYLLTGGIEEFYQKHSSLVLGTELPALKADLGTGS